MQGVRKYNNYNFYVHNKTVITSLRHMSIFFPSFHAAAVVTLLARPEKPVSQKKENLLVSDTRIRFEVHLVLTTHFAITAPRPGLTLLMILINLTVHLLFIKCIFLSTFCRIIAERIKINIFKSKKISCYL